MPFFDGLNNFLKCTPPPSHSSLMMFSGIR
jgi:hypothetical protein